MLHHPTTLRHEKESFFLEFEQEMFSDLGTEAKNDDLTGDSLSMSQTPCDAHLSLLDGDVLLDQSAVNAHGSVDTFDLINEDGDDNDDDDDDHLSKKRRIFHKTKILDFDLITDASLDAAAVATAEISPSSSMENLHTNAMTPVPCRDTNTPSPTASQPLSASSLSTKRMGLSEYKKSKAQVSHTNVRRPSSAISPSSATAATSASSAPTMSTPTLLSEALRQQGTQFKHQGDAKMKEKRYREAMNDFRSAIVNYLESGQAMENEQSGDVSLIVSYYDQLARFMDLMARHALHHLQDVALASRYYQLKSSLLFRAVSLRKDRFKSLLVSLQQQQQLELQQQQDKEPATITLLSTKLAQESQRLLLALEASQQSDVLYRLPQTLIMTPSDMLSSFFS